MHMEDIEFLKETNGTVVQPEDYIRYGIDLDEIRILSKQFKDELIVIGEDFMFNEDKNVFIPLRKYYSTALLIALRRFSHDDDENYNKIKQSQTLGLEIVYLFESKIPEIIMEIQKLFFIDPSHPHLYNFMDGNNDYSFTGMNKEYGYILIHSKINDAINPSQKLDTESLMTDKTNELCNSMFITSWIQSFGDRIGMACNNYSVGLLEDNRKTIEELKIILT